MPFFFRDPAHLGGDVPWASPSPIQPQSQGLPAAAGAIGGGWIHDPGLWWRKPISLAFQLESPAVQFTLASFIPSVLVFVAHNTPCSCPISSNGLSCLFPDVAQGLQPSINLVRKRENLDKKGKSLSREKKKRVCVLPGVYRVKVFQFS